MTPALLLRKIVKCALVAALGVTPVSALAASPGTVVAWGGNFYGQTTVPAGLSGVTAIAAGHSHTVALKSDGKVVAWGAGRTVTYIYEPALGFNRIDNQEYGQSIVAASLSGVVAIAAGGFHTLALKSDGTVAAWGNNSSGETSGTPPASPDQVTARANPVKLNGLALSGVTAIAAGFDHSVASKSDGTVVAWGENGSGQTTVPAGLSGVTAIAAGATHTVALKGDGTVVAWGNNGNGQTTVPASLTGVAAIAAGNYHTVALKSNGTVVAWGTTVPAGLSGVIAIAAGGDHTVALKNNGTVVAWGENGSGQTTIPVGLGGVVAIAAGGYHTMAVVSAPPTITEQPWGLMLNVTSDATFSVTATGTTPFSYQWRKDGVNVTGATNSSLTLSNVQTNQTGNYVVVVTNVYGSVTSSVAVLTVYAASPVVAWGRNSENETTVPVGLSGVAGIAAGGFHTVALKTNGTVVAWGYNEYGQTTVPAGLSGIKSVAGGRYHTVALRSDNTVVAWGYNDFGQTTIPTGLSGVAAIAAGDRHTVAAKNDGTVVAWGLNNQGQATVPAGLSEVVAISAGGGENVAGGHTVVLKGDGTVVAWGGNSRGQATVPAGLSGVTAIAAGYGHCVALKNDGTVVAWGRNDEGQTTVPFGLRGVTAIAAGAYHTVALKGDGTLVAWGWNYLGPTSVPADLSEVVAIAAGYSHTVALKSDGTVKPPSITIQPQSQTVPAGNSVTFSVVAAGTAPLTYQWRNNGTNLTDATGSIYSIANAQTNHAGGYTVVVSNSIGSVTSAPPAVLGVNVPPTITQQPVSQTVLAGANVMFSMAASGMPPFTYQWRKDGTNLIGNTDSSYTIPSVQANHAGSYTVVVSNAGGSVTSTPPAMLVVNGPPSITTQPQSQTVAVGANVSFTVGATGTAPLNYQWRKSGSPITGAISATFTLNNVQLTDTSTYDVVVTNVLGSATSSAATLVVTTNSYTNLVLSVGGSGQYGTVPSSPVIQPSNAITIELWFLPLATAMANPVVLNKGDGLTVSSARSYQVNWSPSSGAYFHLFLGTSTYAPISVPAPVNTWVHLAATYDSATSRINIFTNGILAASTTNDEGGSPLNGQRLRQTTLPLTFGFAPFHANTYFNGSIDEVRIWNFARSGPEIFRNFHSRLAGTEPGLVGYWQFDGGTVTDLTTNANNGSLTGGAQIVAITGADIPHIGAPTIPQASQNLAVAPGTNVTFTVAATSIAPLSYQWFKDGVLLADQTNAQLNLSSLTNRARGGSFSVMVSNLYGAITGNIGSIRVRVPHRLQPPVATNGMFRLLSADQDGGLLTTNDLAFFTFQTSTNLTPTNWLSITYTNGLSLTNGMLRFDDTNTASRPFRYYRVIEQ